MHLISRVIATGFFFGYAPFFPGTMGSFLGLFLYWIIPGSEKIYFLGFIALTFLVGVWAASEVEKQTSVNDNQIIVIDEVVGTFITFILFEKKIIWLAIGFILFRLFDIVKIFPAKNTERLPRGWGVMMDDVVAGIYSAVSLRLIFFIVHKVL
ncbi:MAG: phosphatidylglycerophosphatase A [bacterium]